MEKRFCDGPECGKEIDEHMGFYTLHGQHAERDFGALLSSPGIDFCSLKCLIAYIEKKRMSNVIRESMTDEKGQKITSFTWEGNILPLKDVERKNKKFYLSREAYEKLK